MYKLESALLLKNRSTTGYEKVNIASIKMHDLLSQYVGGYIELTNPGLRRPVYVTPTDIVNSNLPITNVTFNQWLKNIGDRTIPGSNDKPELVTGEVAFIDVFQGGYDVQRVHPQPYVGDSTYPSDQLTAVEIIKGVADITPLQKRCLTTVNGLLHINTPTQLGIMIHGAGTTSDISFENHLGLISFEKIGDVSQVPITLKMISEPNKIYGAKAGLLVNLKKNLKGKTVLFSLGGMLIGLNGEITKMNDSGLIRVNLELLNMVEVIRTVKQIVDTSSLELDKTVTKFGAVHLGDIRTDDDIILALMTLEQSFAIIVDAPILYAEPHTPNTTLLLGTKELMRYTNLPYISDKGLLLSYWRVFYPDDYNVVRRLFLQDTIYRNPVYRTGEGEEYQGFVNDIEEITNPDLEIGKLLLIKSETLK